MLKYICVSLALLTTSLNANQINSSDSHVPIRDKDAFIWNGGVDALLATKNEFEILIVDQVKNGCLPQPGRLEVKMREALTKRGFTIVEKTSASSDILKFVAIGGAVGGGCVVSTNPVLSFPVSVIVPHAIDVKGGDYTITKFDHILSSVLLFKEKASMQAELEKQVSDVVEELHQDVSAAKGKILAKYPSIKKNYLAHLLKSK